MKKFFLGKLVKMSKIFGFGVMESSSITQKKISIEHYLEQKILSSKYREGRRLAIHEYQVFSQNGEDGIIHEIFRRIGIKSKYFVEFGVGNGIENNTAYLLLQKWKGSWIEASEEYCSMIKSEYKNLIKKDVLRVKQSFITLHNIKLLFEDLCIPEQFDLLSIDIDGNDYWIWEALSSYRPRVVVIEYNASIGPHVEWVMPYNEVHVWNGKVGNYFGASLKSFEKLGNKLGYSLVGCNLTGANAFFVRNDCLTNNFEGPFTSENHFEKPMYFLEKQLGHFRNHQVLGTLY